jgi:hypothetical protein
MALTITDTEMTSDLTDARAEFRPGAAADGSGAWIVSTYPGRLLDRDRAITGMTIAEEQTRPEPDEGLMSVLESELW